LRKSNGRPRVLTIDDVALAYELWAGEYIPLSVIAVELKTTQRNLFSAINYLQKNGIREYQNNYHHCLLNSCA